jgi:hypothetical protein
MTVDEIKSIMKAYLNHPDYVRSSMEDLADEMEKTLKEIGGYSPACVIMKIMARYIDEMESSK